MSGLFQPFEPEPDLSRPRRFRAVPLRIVLPNLVTLLALCAGLTAIRMALEDRMELAVYAVVAAAVLDGLDGRLARALKGTSRFGAELDSLADFVNFGVAPAVLLYIWTLDDLGSLGWIGSLIFAIAAALRLARFNVALERPLPPYEGDFFVGVPAPAGAIVVLLPIHLGHIGGLGAPLVSATATLVYAILIGGLMVSRLPAWSLKRSGAQIARDWVVPIMAAAVALVVLLLSYPWQVLTVGSILYLASLPMAWVKRRALAADYAARHPPAPAAGADIFQPEDHRPAD